jgi:hypothetical protein
MTIVAFAVEKLPYGPTVTAHPHPVLAWKRGSHLGGGPGIVRRMPAGVRDSLGQTAQPRCEALPTDSVCWWI